MAKKQEGMPWGCWAIIIVVAAIALGPILLTALGLIHMLGTLIGPVLILALIILAFIGVKRGHQFVKGHAAYPLVALKVKQATRTDTLLIGKLRKDADAVLALVKEHASEPIVKTLGPGIRQDVREILRQANGVLKTRKRLQKLLDSGSDASKEIGNLRSQLAMERDERVAASLKSALASREAEIENYANIRRSIRQLDGLLTEAQASMAELKSRVGAAVVPTSSLPEDPLRARLAEASSKLRSVSEVMHATLSELA